MKDERSIITNGGHIFDFSSPREMTFDIETIAHSLACINRFNGHTRQPYSVAEHCIRMSYFAEEGWPGTPLDNLLHDTAEAFVADLQSPQKRHMYFGLDFAGSVEFIPFKTVEQEVLETVYVKLGLAYDASLEPEIKKMDRIILAMEVRDLLPQQAITWQPYIELFESVDVIPEETIYPWEWQRAEEEYYQRFKELTSGKSETK
jgi:hypothetical protein